jgi:hypothetical protein
MATGTSLLLIAVGAVLAFAVNYTLSGVNIQTVGLILVVVGIIGLLYSLLFMASFAPFGRGDHASHGDHGHL